MDIRKFEYCQSKTRTNIENDMHLFERLNEIAEKISGSQTKMAKDLGIPQGTFNGYLNADGQTKIRMTLMEKILAIYPNVSREWLYFGEGDMLKSEQQMPVPAQPEIDVRELLARLEAVEKKLEIAGEEGDKPPYAGTQAGHVALGARQDGI